MSTTIPPPQTTTTTSKRKSPNTTSTSDPNTPKTIHFTSRTPTWTYLKLQLITNPPTSTSSTPLDPLTARTYLSAALSQFLGLTGTSIPIDILKISPSSSTSQKGKSTGGLGSSGSTVWTRVPRDDAAAVVAALSSWIGGNTGSNISGGGSGSGGDAEGNSVAWRVCAKGNYLGALVHGDGGEVFVP
ncbi:hypothetical protein ASPBRDRAFT_133052 [Aspergillus brasiliensis CBS 101740]|uniref:Ribonucleases P/MRP subunit Pop8-like domain-containing protein n=1 Tax=Aspergillus brasiliensis (strain CBS 101740 / IMI 381727 / IBT 21946) TaxID=767769 RepID=A0A1L9UAH5_ASPBC|nr:hypothetical protein ASPBRDRAFT_133052 [Aspergillus brasiliensis CBS 101740]